MKVHVLPRKFVFWWRVVMPPSTRLRKHFVESIPQTEYLVLLWRENGEILLPFSSELISKVQTQ